MAPSVAGAADPPLAGFGAIRRCAAPIPPLPPLRRHGAERVSGSLEHRLDTTVTHSLMVWPAALPNELKRLLGQPSPGYGDGGDVSTFEDTNVICPCQSLTGSFAHCGGVPPCGANDCPSNVYGAVNGTGHQYKSSGNCRGFGNVHPPLQS